MSEIERLRSAARDALAIAETLAAEVPVTRETWRLLREAHDVIWADPPASDRATKEVEL